MKKTMKLWLFMLIVLLLAGCGNNGDSSDNTERKEDESSTSIEVENNEDNQMEEPAWDTEWASNEFENLIPHPPFNGWKGEKKSDYEYEMVTSEANADGSGNYYEEFKTFFNKLLILQYTENNVQPTLDMLNDIKYSKDFTCLIKKIVV